MGINAELKKKREIELFEERDAIYKLKLNKKEI